MRGKTPSEYHREMLSCEKRGTTWGDSVEGLLGSGGGERKTAPGPWKLQCPRLGLSDGNFCFALAM